MSFSAPVLAQRLFSPAYTTIFTRFSYGRDYQDKQFIIRGIIKDVPENSHIRFDFLLPITQLRERADRDWSYDCVSYLTLNEDVNLSVFQDKISGFIRKNDTMDWEVLLQAQPIRRIHLYSLNGTDPITYIYIFIGLVLVILFIGCVNFINLSAIVII